MTETSKGKASGDSKVNGSNLTASGKSDANTSAGKKPDEKKERSKKDKSNSFKKIRGYAYRECCSIITGLCFLILGMGSDILIPLFIG